MSLTSIAAAWVLSWLCTRRRGRSAATSSLPTSAIMQERCFRLQSSSGSLRYSRERKTQPHLSKEPPLPSDDRRHPLYRAKLCVPLGGRRLSVERAKAAHTGR